MLAMALVTAGSSASTAAAAADRASPARTAAWNLSCGSCRTTPLDKKTRGISAVDHVVTRLDEALAMRA